MAVAAMPDMRQPPALQRILLVEDDLGDARLVAQTLKREFPGTYKVVHVESIKDAVTALVAGDGSDVFDAILLDLNLSDSIGLQGFSIISDLIGNRIPIIVLSGLDDETLAERAIQTDAQDYVAKSRMTGGALDRAIRYAIERQKNRAALHAGRERFRQFARIASDRFWEMDENLIFTGIPGGSRGPSRPHANEMNGLALWDIEGLSLAGDTDWSAFRADLKAHRSFQRVEIVFRDEDDEPTYWWFSGEPVTEVDDVFAGYRGTMTDVTDKVRTSRELSAAMSELEILNAQKDKFFSIIAHDLRSPFATMVGVAEAFRNGLITADSDKLVEYGGMIHANANRALNLVEDLLEWSRLQLGGTSFDSESLSLKELVAGNIELASTPAAKKNIDLIDETADDLMVVADRQAVNAIIRNLVANAVKFTESGGSVTIATEERGNRVILSVADTGVGIPDEIRSKLFEIDEKTTTRGTNDERGTGLGLVLCGELAAKNGFTIDIDSTVGVGTRISVSMPHG